MLNLNKLCIELENFKVIAIDDDGKEIEIKELVIQTMKENEVKFQSKSYPQSGSKGDEKYKFPEKISNIKGYRR